MTTRKIIARNVLCNLVGMAIAMAVGFVIAPLLVHRLGNTTYGLWILIGSLTGYFNFLDLGVRGSVGRYIAYHRARDDQPAVNAILSTSLAILVGIGLLALLGAVVIQFLFFHLFDVPADQQASARLALFIVGLNLALTFPFNVFEAVLWAHQRFDVLNAVDIATVLLRGGLTFALVESDGGLVTLALITLGMTLLSGTAKLAASVWLHPGMRFALRNIRRAVGREIYGYGVWHFVLDITARIAAEVSLILVGAWWTMQAVTSYSIALRLTAYASAVVGAAAGVLTPVATAFNAAQDLPQQQRLFLRGGQCCTAAALFFLAVFLWLGQPLIVMWMGPGFADSAVLLFILAIGQVLPLSQRVTHSMVLAMGRHRFTACVSVVECAAAIVLALLLRDHGLAGLCLAFALCAAISRGLVQVFYGCHLAQIAVRHYVAHALLLPLAGAALPVAVLALLTRWAPPTTFPGLLACGTAFVAVFLPAMWLVLTPRKESRAEADLALLPPPGRVPLAKSQAT